jgi:hypothetical protein
LACSRLFNEIQVEVLSPLSLKKKNMRSKAIYKMSEQHASANAPVRLDVGTAGMGMA